MENDIQTALSNMQEDFIAHLPDRLTIFKALLADLECGRADSLRTLHREAHSLAGAAGVHGLVSISEAARGLEQIAATLSANGVLDEQGLEAIRSAVENLQAQTLDPSRGFAPKMPNKETKMPYVVIVDNDKDQADWLRFVFEQAGYGIQAFHEPEAFSAASLSSELPSALILGELFPESGDAGMRAIATLKQQHLNSFPVIFISIHQEMAAKLAAYRAGATCYLTKPVNKEALLRAVADSAALMPKVPFRVLWVDDDPEQPAAQSLILRQAGMTVLETAYPLKVPEMLEDFAAEVLVLDMNMRECSGPELAAILRDDERYGDMPIIYLSAETCVSSQLLELNRGGDYVLAKSLDPRHLVSAVALHAKRFRQTREQAEALRTTLYEQERQQQALDVHAIVSAADISGAIIYVNDRFCEISGYRPEELLGQNHRVVKSSQHSSEFYRDMWLTIAQGNIWRGEVCNRRKDGSLYWVETSIVPFLDNTGRPYQYVSIRTDITRIKEAELRLRLLERAVEASTSSISMADAGKPDMPLIYINPAFERITGYRRDEVLGRNCRFLQGEDPGQASLDEIRRALRAGRAGEALVYNYRKDGTPFWNDLRIAPVHDEQGRLTHFIGISDDVTKRREAEDALLQSKERLRRSQLYANIGTWDWNIQTGELIWSERIPGLFGYPEDKLEATYEHFLESVYPDDRQKVIEAVNNCVEHGFEYNIEHRCLWPDGTVRWLLERGDVVRAEDGTPLNMLGVVQDITNRKLAEFRILDKQARLLIFNHIIENVADAVITIDCAGNIGSFNPAAEKLFGYSRSEVINRNVSLLMPEPYSSEHSQYLARYMSGQPAGIIGKQIELPGKHKDGSVFPMELAITVMDINNAKHFAGILRDISERKQYEQQIIAAKDEAERANNAKSEFLSSMSHELRTPMNAILGFGQLLEIDEGLSEEQADYVDEMIKAGRHLLELINEVLDLAKIESGNVNMSLESLSCAELIEECLALLRPIAQGLGVTIKDAVVGDFVIRADRTRLKQVLLNLISNAIKYNRPQGQVAVQASAQDGLVRLAVSDTGYGIPAGRQRELFQPFSRLGAESTTIEGTGIGLTISRRLIEMMGGAIGMASEEGRGSTFWVELPEGALKQDSQTNNPQEQAVAVKEAIADGYRYTVLYIEDNPANLRLVARILDRNPQLQLITAHTPELGLELASARHPELILLDINLPGMDGYQVLSVLRSLDSTKKTPVIAISANATSRDIERGIAAGFDEYITKPIDIAQFLGAVDGLLPDK